MRKYYIQIKLKFITIMELILSEEFQKKGAVIIYYGLDQSDFNPEIPFQYAAAKDVLPYRVSGNHFCYDNPRIKQFIPLVEMAISIVDLCKFRAHFGKSMLHNDE